MNEEHTTLTAITNIRQPAYTNTSLLNSSSTLVDSSMNNGEVFSHIPSDFVKKMTPVD